MLVVKIWLFLHFKFFSGFSGVKIWLFLRFRFFSGSSGVKIWLFLRFGFFSGFSGIKVSVILRFGFGFIAHNNSLVLIPLFCAINSIISLDSSIDRFKSSKFIISIYNRFRQKVL